MTNRRGSSRLGAVACARAAGEPNVTIAAAALVSFRNSRRCTGGVGMGRGFAAAIRNKTGKESTLPLRQVLHDGGLKCSEMHRLRSCGDSSTVCAFDAHRTLPEMAKRHTWDA